MRIIYRISDAGYNKVKPDYINNENCLANATKEFDDSIWSVIADNISSDVQGSAAYGNSSDYTSGSFAGGGVFAQSYSTQEQAISNLKNLLLTNKGERYMQPTFGTRIKSVLFDNNTPMVRETLQEVLQEDIEFWLPYISVDQIDVISSDDRQSISIRLHFEITTIGANMVINVLLSENQFEVSDAEVDNGTSLVQVDTIGTGTAFGVSTAY